MKQVKRVSPYGELDWIAPADRDRYIYVYKADFEEEGFKPESAWYVTDALGNRLYLKARDRKKAEELVVNFFGSAKYSLVSDKVVSIR